MRIVRLTSDARLADYDRHYAVDAVLPVPKAGS